MSATATVQATVDAWNNADRQGFVACYADDCEITSPESSGRGHDAVAAFWSQYMGAMPDCQVVGARLVVDGDTVAEEATVQGTNTGPSVAPDGSEIPPTGRSVALPFAALHTVRDGRIVSSRFYWDVMTVLGQLDLLPEPAAG